MFFYRALSKTHNMSFEERVYFFQNVFMCASDSTVKRSDSSTSSL